MKSTVVILVSGESLTDGKSSNLDDQHENSNTFADVLLPVIKQDVNVAILHGNKPQVGYVLFRSELASYILHPIPLDVCGADTQGATGYLLTQTLRNKLRKENISRSVYNLMTQTEMVPADTDSTPFTAIGPLFDREKAEQYRHTRGWSVIEEPGSGYRRSVHTLQPSKILEMEGIKKLVNDGDIVIAAGGGGIPVIPDANGELRGVEVVVETEAVAAMMANELEASVLVMLVDKDDKFILTGIPMHQRAQMSLEQIEEMLEKGSIRSDLVRRNFKAAATFLRNGGQQVFITSMKNFADRVERKTGLRIGNNQTDIELFNF